jgi:hypothetical protein
MYDRPGPNLPRYSIDILDVFSMFDVIDTEIRLMQGQDDKPSRSIEENQADIVGIA